jgi:hypothetical protein
MERRGFVWIVVGKKGARNGREGVCSRRYPSRDYSRSDTRARGHEIERESTPRDSQAWLTLCHRHEKERI